jgi:hypothetical protein
VINSKPQNWEKLKKKEASFEEMDFDCFKVCREKGESKSVCKNICSD